MSREFRPEPTGVIGNLSMATPPAVVDLGNYPLSQILQPHAHDVLCGRGGGTNNHIGNSHWRMLVAANKQLYVTLPKRQKMLLSKSIVHAVRSQQPPGRFLQKDSNTDLWTDIGDQRAQEKTSQALREGAPDLRSKLKDDPKKDDTERRTDEETALTMTSKPEDGNTEPAPEASHSAVPSHVPSQVLGPSTGQGPSASQPSASAVPLMPPVGEHPRTQQMQQQMGQQIPAPVQQQMPQQVPQQMPPQMQQQMPPQMQQQMTHQMQQQMQQQMTHQMQQQMPQQMRQQFPQHVGAIPGVMPAMSHGTAYMPQQGYPGHHSSMPSNHSSQVGMPPVIMYTAPNMQNPVQMYPTMMYNEQGVLVPVMTMVPPVQPNATPQPQPTISKPSPSNPTVDLPGEKNTPSEEVENAPKRSHTVAASKSSEKDSEILPPTGGLYPGGLSFGSAMSEVGFTLSESEMKQLEEEGAGFGLSNGAAGTNGARSKPSDRYWGNPDPVAPVDGGLDSNGGFSFGSISAMSIGDGKLESTGISFGSVMSFQKIPEMVDGGLDGVGLSFGSMSLAPESSNDGFTIPPPTNAPTHKTSTATLSTLVHQNRSKGNLLECSDTDSETEEDTRVKSQQKSQDWERLQATISGSGAFPIEPNPMMPIGLNSQAPNFDSYSGMAPATNNQADLGALEAAAAMPPPPPRKETSGEVWHQVELMYLQRGNSLAEEEFGESGNAS